MKLASIATSVLFLLLPPQTAPTGRITGIVIQSGTDRPIDGVEIVATPLAAATGPPALAPIGSYTDAAGRFTLEGLAPGRYRMEWKRAGYFTPPVGTAAPDTAIREILQAQLGVARVFVASPPAAIYVMVDVAPGQKSMVSCSPNSRRRHQRAVPIAGAIRRRKQLTALQLITKTASAFCVRAERRQFDDAGTCGSRAASGRVYITCGDRPGNARAYPGTVLCPMPFRLP
jgi:hypothetical protein